MHTDLEGFHTAILAALPLDKLLAGGKREPALVGGGGKTPSDSLPLLHPKAAVRVGVGRCLLWTKCLHTCSG
jgi:hypothetical protein